MSNYCTKHGQFYTEYCVYCGSPFKITSGSSGTNVPIESFCCFCTGVCSHTGPHSQCTKHGNVTNN